MSIACWATLFLGANPEWKAKVKAEISAMVNEHTTAPPTASLQERLASIPIYAWEDNSLPTTELIVRETLRVMLSGTTLRRNLSADPLVAPGGKKIPRGAFLCYNIADAHLNPEIYTEPEKFDPERFLPPREEDKRSPHAFLGWGVGRHPCTAMKVAKFEIHMLLAFFLLGYEYELVDAQGRFPNPLPKPDRNDIQQVRFVRRTFTLRYSSAMQARPLGDPVYLKFKRTADKEASSARYDLPLQH